MLKEWTREIVPRGDGFILTFLCDGDARGAIALNNLQEKELWMKLTENLNAISLVNNGKN